MTAKAGVVGNLAPVNASANKMNLYPVCDPTDSLLVIIKV
jgi:hypothetical protein